MHDMDPIDWVTVAAVFSMNLALGVLLFRGGAALVMRFLG